MKAIIKSINEKSKIKSVLFNIRQEVKGCNNLIKMLAVPELMMDEIKTWEVIQDKINTMVNDLADIEPLCIKYVDLYGKKFEATKKQLHAICKKQILIFKPVTL